MRGGLSIQKSMVMSQPIPTQQAEAANVQIVGGMLVILLPAALVWAIAAYRKHKATVLQRRINHLNRLWQMVSSIELP